MGLLRINLFAYPRYSHYYFGDYYDEAYLSLGIYPWFDSRRLHTWYDPVYEHDRWSHHRSEPRWEERGRADYNSRRADTNLRPARTFREQESRLARLPETQRRSLQVTQPITTVASRRKPPMKFERINTDARQKISRQATAVRTFREERNRWESASAAKTTPPQAERRETALPPKERKLTVTPAVAQREPVSAPSRQNRVSQPERVHIPPPPVVGGSGKPGIFRKGPPARPANEEGRAKKDGDVRKK